MEGPTLETTANGAGRALIVLSLIGLSNYIDRSLLSILQIPIKKDLDLSDTQLGALTGLSFAVFYAIAALPMARLVDRGRRTWIMAAALFVWNAMTAMSALAWNFASLAALRIGVALGEAGSVPATHSLLSDYFPIERRSTVFAVWALGQPIGIMLGVFFGGWLEHQLGWRGTFAAIGMVGLLLVPLTLRLKEPPRGQFELPPPTSSRLLRVPPLSVAVRTLWTMRSFRLLVIAATLHVFAYTALLNWLPPFYARVHHMELPQVAVWSALIIGIGGSTGAFAGGVIVDFLSRWDRRWYAWAPATALLLSVPAGVAMCLTPATDLSIAFGFVAVFFGTFFVAPVNAAAQSLVSPFMRGFTSAVLLVVPNILGLGLGPLVTGIISDILITQGLGEESLRYALPLALLTSLVAGLVYFRIGRTFLGDLAAVTSSPNATSSGGVNP